MDETLVDRVLRRVQALYPELGARRNPRELIHVPELGNMDAHLFDVEQPLSGRVLATSYERKGHTHVARFDPTDDSSLDEAVHDAVAYLRSPRE